MLMPLTVVLAELSALSVAVPVTDWFAAFAERVVGGLDVFTPDRASVGVNETVTSVLFHPLAFAAGVRVPMMPGAVLSSLTCTEPVPVLPTLSVTVVVRVTIPSLVTVSDEGVSVFTPEPPESLPVQVTFTFARFQPAALGAGLKVAEAVGAVLSSTYDALAASVWPLQPLPLLPLPTVMFAVCRPLPLPAVTGGNEYGLEPVVIRPVTAPVELTHLVLSSVVTVRVSAAPCLA